MCNDKQRQNESTYEQVHVHNVYDVIAPHFSSTRYKPWPVVDDFLKHLRPGSVGLDVGCGNGKYLTVNKDVFIIASDRSSELIRFARQHQPHSSLIADTLSLPHPPATFDFAISIAVIHHLASTERRRNAISAILETLKPNNRTVESTTNADESSLLKQSTPSSSSPGRALFFVWALEQKDSRRGWDRGDEQDVLVPWVLKSPAKSDTTEAAAAAATTTTTTPTTTPAEEGEDSEKKRKQPTTYHRYYHLYRQGELEDDIVAAGGKVTQSGYDRDNWWAIAERAT